MVLRDLVTRRLSGSTHSLTVTFATTIAVTVSFGAASVTVDWVPMNTVNLDEDQASTMIKLIDALEDSDDVQSTFSNFEVSDEVMAKLSA